MAHTYCFYNNKGGVGKTTLCANAAALYAKAERVNEFETVVGGFYVAFEPASLSSVSWLLGDGCWVMAAR